MHSEFLLAACRGLSKAGQKNRLQNLSTATDTALRSRLTDLDWARLRWEVLKETVKAGATPSSADGFHKLFEEAIARAYPTRKTLTSLLGRFKFREAKTPLDGMQRLEKVERWLPFEPGEIVAMPGRGVGKVVETNFALESVRVDFEKAKGIAVPIGVAMKSLAPLPPDHFLREKLTNPAAVSAQLKNEPAKAMEWIIQSLGPRVSVGDVKEAVQGILDDDAWTSFWSAVRKHPQVIVHGTGRTATIEWSQSIEDADTKLLQKFERSSLLEQLDFFRKNIKRSSDLTSKLAASLSREAAELRKEDPAAAFEIGVLIEKTPGGNLAFPLQELIPENLVPFLGRITDRPARERALEIFEEKFPEKAARILADWFFKEEETRTLDAIDKDLNRLDPALREQTLDRLLKNPRLGPRAFFWFAQRAGTDEALRNRLTPGILSRLLDSISWSELSAVRTRIREMFDRTGLAAIWLVKIATEDEARTFLDALGRHHELESFRVSALVKAVEMKFPALRKDAEEEIVFVTPEALEEKRHELEHILKVEIPENTKGIAIAAAEGDLSENFEYKARREKQQLLSARAGQLQQALRLTRALDPGAIDPSEVRPGTKLTVTGEEGEKTITILGPWDSKPEEGIYSYVSELGKALLGKKPGDEATVLGSRVRIDKIDVWRPAETN